MANKAEKYLAWLTSALQSQSDYHNHKETMSWVATALYVPGIIALGYLFNTKLNGEVITFWQHVLVFLFFAVLAALVFTFVYRQFRLRSRASDVVDALIELLNELSNDDSIIESWDTEIKKDKHWPQFIENKILPGKGRKLLTIITTDIVCYLAIILSTVFGLLLICI